MKSNLLAAGPCERARSRFGVSKSRWVSVLVCIVCFVSLYTGQSIVNVPAHHPDLPGHVDNQRALPLWKHQSQHQHKRKHSYLLCARTVSARERTAIIMRTIGEPLHSKQLDLCLSKRVCKQTSLLLPCLHRRASYTTTS
jgi:hypothetical protein